MKLLLRFCVLALFISCICAKQEIQWRIQKLSVADEPETSEPIEPQPVSPQEPDNPPPEDPTPTPSDSEPQDAPLSEPEPEDSPCGPTEPISPPEPEEEHAPVEPGWPALLVLSITILLIGATLFLAAIFFCREDQHNSYAYEQLRAQGP